MHAKGLAELALKIWAVMLIVQAFLALPAALSMLTLVANSASPQDLLIRATQRGHVFNLVIYAVSGIALLIWADKVVALFESDTTPLQIGVTASDVQILGFALTGIFFLVGGLQNAAAVALVFITKPPLDPDDIREFFWEHHGEAMIKAVIQIAAGVLLIFGRTTIARGWSTLRGHAGPGTMRSSNSAE